MVTVRWLAALTVLLVLIQAAMIGQYLFQGAGSLLSLHGWLGSGSLLLSLLLTGAAFMAAQRGELPRSVIVYGIVVVVLMVVQLGLGYMGRKLGWSAAIHIPNGVIIASLLSALVGSTFITPRQGVVR
jgi:hypothetical protein